MPLLEPSPAASISSWIWSMPLRSRDRSDGSRMVRCPHRASSPASGSKPRHLIVVGEQPSRCDLSRAGGGSSRSPASFSHPGCESHAAGLALILAAREPRFLTLGGKCSPHTLHPRRDRHSTSCYPRKTSGAALGASDPPRESGPPFGIAFELGGRLGVEEVIRA